jgi:hypothetical protein
MMRNKRWFWLILVACSSACEVHVGDGGFDGSFWDDFDDSGSTGSIGFDPAPPARRDAGRVGVGDEDGGVQPVDASKPIDAGSTTSSDASSMMTPDNSPDAVAGYFARGMCGALEACIGEERTRLALKGNDCVEFTTRQLKDRQLHWLMQSISGRRVTFAPDRLAACQRDITAFGCDVKVRRLPASCTAALEGLRDIDENCSIDFDCSGRAYCDKGTLETCPGTCAELQPAGLPCEASAQCADGLLCRDGVCKLSRADGDACTVRFGSECADGLICQGKAGALTCQNLKSVYVGARDAACDRFGKLCADGFVCRSQNATSSAGVCAAISSANGTCRAAEPSQCPVGQYCKEKSTAKVVGGGVDGVCADRPRDGQACSASGAVPDCAPGFACVGDPPTCRPLHSAGGDCISNAQCYGGLCQSGTCVVTTIECR